MKTSALHANRVLFSRLIAELIQWIFDQGYEVMICQDGLKHKEGSLHYVGLAVDLLLFLDGDYLTRSEQYRFAGLHWKAMNPGAAWGGDFSAPDGNHFSIRYMGKR